MSRSSDTPAISSPMIVLPVAVSVRLKSSTCHLNARSSGDIAYVLHILRPIEQFHAFEPGIDIKSHIRRQYPGLARALKCSRDHLKLSRSCMPYSNTPHTLVFLGLRDRWFQEISISAIDASSVFFIPNFYQFCLQRPLPIPRRPQSSQSSDVLCSE